MPVRFNFYPRYWRFWMPAQWSWGPGKLGAYQYGPVRFNPVHKHTRNGVRWVLWLGNVELRRYEACTCS